MWDLLSILLRRKSSWRARFSAFLSVVECNNSSDFRAKASDACDNTAPSGRVDEQASQNEQVIITGSGRAVKSTKDCDNFVYY